MKNKRILITTPGDKPLSPGVLCHDNDPEYLSQFPIDFFTIPCYNVIIK